MFKQHIRDWDDEELVQAYYETGDPGCAGELFRRYTHLVFLSCLKYIRDEADSEDAAMQLFEKLLSDLRKYKVEHFRNWLHTVTRNHCLAWLEQRKRFREHHARYEEERRDALMRVSEALAEDGGTQKEKQLNELEEAMGLLKWEQRRCLELFYLEQKPYQEVASVTGYSLKQVKSYIQNGKRNLKNHLNQRKIHE